MAAVILFSVVIITIIAFINSIILAVGKLVCPESFVFKNSKGWYKFPSESVTP